MSLLSITPSSGPSPYPGVLEVKASLRLLRRRLVQCFQIQVVSFYSDAGATSRFSHILCFTWHAGRIFLSLSQTFSHFLRREECGMHTKCESWTRVSIKPQDTSDRLICSVFSTATQQQHEQYLLLHTHKYHDRVNSHSFSTTIQQCTASHKLTNQVKSAQIVAYLK